MQLSLSFTTYSFMLFTAITILIYYLIPKKWQWPFLLIVSMGIYTVSTPVFTIFLIITLITSWLSGMALDKKKKKIFLILPLLVNLGLLIYAKYTGFIIENITGLMNSLSGHTSEFKPLNILVPLGISFYTFQSLSYVFDVYSGKISAEKNIFKYLLFGSFFPQMLQGPISRYGDLSKTLFNEHKADSKNLAFGAQRILFGYFKKLVLADRIYILVNAISRDTSSFGGAWFLVVTILYTLELYADFSGGIDITIGIAEMLGIRVTENFIRPFFSSSVSEFWNRWHVTMGGWFRDYIYIPLGGSRVKAPRLVFNFFIVWLTTGIWHGAGWNYILWGMCNFAVIISSKFLDKPYSAIRNALKCDNKLWYKIFAYIRTWLIASLFFTTFVFNDVRIIINGISGLFKKGSFSVLSHGELFNHGLSEKDFIILSLGFIALIVIAIIEEKDAKAKKTLVSKEEAKTIFGEHAVRERITKLPYIVKVVFWLALFTIVLLLGAYGRGYDAAQFIYNRY